VLGDLKSGSGHVTVDSSNVGQFKLSVPTRLGDPDGQTSSAAPPVPSYASGISDQPLLGDTIGVNLDRVAALYPHRDALGEVTSGLRWTYREFVDRVDALALGMLDAGLAKGDRVGIWAPNCASWTLTQYATAKLGMVLVNINPAYRTHELEYVLNQAGVRMLVAAREFKTCDYAALIDEVRPRCAALERVVLLESPDWVTLANGSADGDRARVAAAQANLSPDDPINIQYTSGTTGFPKGATLSHHNILNNGFFFGELCGYTEEDRVCIPVPFYHCFGMVMGNLGATSHGAAMVIPAPAFDPALTLAGCRPSGVPRCTACRRCSSRSWPTRTSSPTTCPPCAPGSWAARRARWI
jgi:fatty-acyl-CoA synthase